MRQVNSDTCFASARFTPSSQAGAAHGVDDGAKALALLEGLDFGAARVHAARARFLAGMARRATAKRGDMAAHKAARDFFHATLEVAQDLGWWAFAARATFEEARSAFKVNDLEGARRALEREAGIQERRGNLLGVSEALGSIGHYIHRRAGRFAEARDVFERALDFAQRAGDAQQARWSRRALASACARLGDFDRAMALYDELQVHADAHGRPEDRAELRIKRAGILRLQGDLAAGTFTDLSALLAAHLELRGPARLDWVARTYLFDPARGLDAIEAALTALGVHGDADAAVPRARVVEVYRRFIRERPAMAGFVAADLLRWEEWGATRDYAALLDKGAIADPAGVFAAAAYVRSSPDAAARAQLDRRDD